MIAGWGAKGRHCSRWLFLGNFWDVASGKDLPIKTEKIYPNQNGNVLPKLRNGLIFKMLRQENTPSFRSHVV
jgi:hypothetical protein